jgi:Protein of unknown function (DUF3159)
VAPSEQRFEPNLGELLGGRGAALDATIPVIAFVVGLTLAQAAGWPAPVGWAGGAAVVAALVLGTIRMARGGRPRAVLVGLLGVAIATLIALYTGRAADFFLVQIVANAASAMGWAVSIVIRWPLLGVLVGAALGQRSRWRQDRHLVRGYQRASWVWVGQYVLRLVVFLPLYLSDAVVALGIARLLLTWPLVALCVAAALPLIRSALPPGHPGLRHPQGREIPPA